MQQDVFKIMIYILYTVRHLQFFGLGGQYKLPAHSFCWNSVLVNGFSRHINLANSKRVDFNHVQNNTYPCFKCNQTNTIF